MSLGRIDAAEAVSRLASFDAVIDARSESEYQLDHLPGARNWPTLHDAERHTVGTEYKQRSAFEARLHGAALAARNIATHLEREAPGLTRGWRPLVYCWRGGQRSGALALVLSQIGFDVTVLDGGYRAFRKLVLEQLEILPSELTLHVLCGKTGTGKSRLLSALAAEGAQVLDLEALAGHRGSVLGALAAGQPGQKRFETLLWSELRRFDRAREVFVESESRTIGRLRLPEPLLVRMRAARCVDVQMPGAARIALLLQDYPHLTDDVEGLCERLDALRAIRGADVVARWQAAARARRWHELVGELLEQHYDPIYQRSMSRNFALFTSAPVLQLDSGMPEDLRRAARQLHHELPVDRGSRLPGSVGSR
jgi:tRNA 2-selenouridine synthase